MRVVAESQPVLKPGYVHLAYVSAENTATLLLSAGIVLGIIILLRAALSAWHTRARKKDDGKSASPRDVR